ncbi:CMD domain protein [Microvirga sp. 0TCS3.31]
MSDVSIIEELAGVRLGSALAQTLLARMDIMKLSQASYDAIIRPCEPGGVSHAERAALAARMARQNADETLTEHYLGKLREACADPKLNEPLLPAEVANYGNRLNAMVRHMDLLTHEPRKAARTDIIALKDAGISEPDIVRLSELAAFVNYQVRVIAGLKMLRGML